MPKGSTTGVSAVLHLRVSIRIKASIQEIFFSDFTMGLNLMEANSGFSDIWGYETFFA
jgi:hypothetical protein